MNTMLWKVAGWLLPHRIFVRLADSQRRRAEAERLERETGCQRKLAAPNAALKLRHKGARGFVLCNGPSVSQQDLLPLAGEIVISVSNGYHHPDFSRIKPRYHCVPQVTYATLTEDEVVIWLKEMHDNLGDAELFLSTTEEPLVRKHNLFPGRTVHYVLLYDSFEELPAGVIPDIANSVPRVQSVAIMALIVALYMGMESIYLLGTEHDLFKTRKYTYFYEPTVLRDKDFTAPGGEVTSSNYDIFHDLGFLWRQYRAIRKIAEANDVQIWNATAGGELDEFPRVRLDEIFKSGDPAQ